jgi:predicted NUDIX family NTP pyrophosphohydrolase
MKEMEESLEKFNTLKTNNFFTTELKNDYEEPEWGFPKGRRNPNEKNLKCALREFYEEIIGKVIKSPVNQYAPIQYDNLQQQDFINRS